MLKVAYISPAYFSNVDISYINEMKNYCDIYYFAIIYPSIKGCAIELDAAHCQSGIYEAIDLPEMNRFDTFVDLRKTKLIIRNQKHSWDLQNFILTKHLYSLLKKEHFDVIHVTQPFSFFEWPLLAMRNKIVLSVHDPFRHSSQRSKLVAIYRSIMFRSLSHFIIFNQSQKQDFINHYHLQNKHVYDSALSTYSYLQIYAHPTQLSNHYALFLGKIYSYKGLEYLFPAMKKVHEKHPDFKLVVAGGGQFYFDISPYKNCDYIDIRNYYYSDEEQANLIANADFLVCPYNDATQSGVIMSAYAFNKPCLVTRTGGLPEMVGNGEYGVIIPPRDTQALVDAMNKMIENPELLQEYSHKIHKEYYEEKKSWKYLAQEIVMNVYTPMKNHKE